MLLATGGPDRQRDLASLSPVPAAQQALDAELRSQLGAPDVRSLFVIGPLATEGEMLQRAEALGAAAQALVARGLLTGLDLPSRYLSSPALQASRQAALPDEAALTEALREAAAGLPFRPTAFARFVAAVAESRSLPPLDLATLAAEAPTIAARLSPLVSRHGNEIWGIAPPPASPIRWRWRRRPPDSACRACSSSTSSWSWSGCWRPMAAPPWAGRWPGRRWCWACWCSGWAGSAGRWRWRRRSAAPSSSPWRC
ncbi:hypothetical protein ACFQU2_33025 [Siccirubricoccus deserti]